MIGLVRVGVFQEMNSSYLCINEIHVTDTLSKTNHIQDPPPWPNFVG